MKPETTVQRLLRKYGDPALWNSKLWSVIIQPLYKSNNKNMVYRCLSTCDFLPDTGDIISYRNAQYTVLRSEIFTVAGEPIYSWCILEKLSRFEEVAA